MAAEGSGGNYDNPNNKPDVKAGVKPPITPEVLGNVLVGIDFYHTEQSKTEEVKEQLSRVMTETLGSPYKSVDELDKVIEQGRNTDEVREAKRDKKLLADGVDVALRKKRESGQISDDELRLGSQHLTNGLHEVIKGVGGDVSDRYVDKGLDPHLNRLEAARLNRNSHIDDAAYTEMLLQRIDMAIPKVLSVDTDSGDAVVVALNHERANLRVELGYEPNSGVGSVNTVEQKRTSSRGTESESKERKPGPTAENDRITEENNRILAGLIDALNKNTVRTEENTVALDENTKRLIELTNAANALGVRIEGLTTAISGEEIQTIVKQFEDEGIFEKGDIGGEDMERMRAALPVEVDDPSVVGRSPDEMRRSRELADTLRAAKLKERLDSDIKNGTKKLSGESDHEHIIDHAEWDRTIGGLYKLLEKIEDGDRSIDDLSTNSSKFTLLYFIKNGEFNDLILGLNRDVQVLDGKGKPIFDKDGKPIYRSEKMTSETLDYLKNEIGMRLFLHSFYMAASKCASIEDMVRVVVSMHEGDVYKDLDKLFVSFFLKNRDDLKLRGAGLTELPIDKAWDWRQLGYFRIETLLDYAKDDQKGFLNYLDTQMGVNEGGSLAEILEGAREKGVNNNIISLYLKFLGSGEDRPTSEIMAKPPMPLVMNEANPNNVVFNKMIKLGKAVPYKDTQHGIDRDYYKNFWMIEIDGSTQATFLKEYMIWRIMGRKEQFYTEKQARRAFELAKRFSVATFMDAAADLNFEKDPYADDINFQLQRAADGPQGEQNRRAKNKNVGHPDTIVKIKGLNCHWMYSLRSKEIKTKKGETMIRAVTPSYSPLYASDLDMGLYNRKSGMVRHFLGIVESQSEFVKSAFLTKFTPKDVMSQGFLNDLFAKINKTVYDMCDAGIMSVNFEDVNQYNGLYYEESKADAQAMIADQFRAAWVYNVFRMAMEEETGWNLTEMDKFIRKLRYSSTMAGEVTEEIRKDKKPIYGSGFIKKELLDNAIRDTGIRRFLARRDSIEEFNAGSSKILGGLFKGGK